MKRTLLILSILISFCASAQTPSGSKVRYQGSWFLCKDTATLTSADTASIVYQCKDSTFYARGLGYWSAIAKMGASGLFVKIADTAAMLSNRLKISDTATMKATQTLDRVLSFGNTSGRAATVGTFNATSATLTGNLKVSGSAGTYREMQLSTSGSLRWSTFADNAAETGSNAGSNYAIARYTDAGVFIDQPFVVNRATGNLQLSTISAGLWNGSPITNAYLANTFVNIIPGAGLSGGGVVQLGNAITLTNTGVTSIVAGNNITISGATGAVTINATSSGGSLTSVAVSGANGIGVIGSPITNSGTIALSLGAITPSSINSSGAITGTTLAATIVTSSQPNITSLGTLGVLTVSTSVTANNHIGAGTGLTGTATGLSIGGNAATVTTNANLTGPITSVGNATSVAAQTGTGSIFVMNTSPTLVTPNIGAATGSSLNLSSGALTAGTSSLGTTTATGTGGFFSTDNNGQVISQQSLDVATAGGRFTGKSSRGTLGFITIEQATTSADGGKLKFYVAPSGSTSGTLAGTINSDQSWLFASSVTATSLIKSGGIPAQILAADGSVITAGTNITISGGIISATATAVGGVFTPTLTNTANVASSALANGYCTYSQNNNIVTVGYSITVTPTLSATLTTMTIALPVTASSSVIPQNYVGSATAYQGATTTTSGVNTIGTTTTATVGFFPISAVAYQLCGTFQYRVN